VETECERNDGGWKRGRGASDVELKVVVGGRGGLRTRAEKARSLNFESSMHDREYDTRCASS
jgi:phage terminase small subunit